MVSISDAEGSLVVQEVAMKPLTQDLLNPEVRNESSPNRSVNGFKEF